MVSSTAIPIAIAAMVIVIISKGIFSQPIIPKRRKIGTIFETNAIKTILDDLNNICNEKNIDILVIAGDIYDSKNPPVEAEKLYFKNIKL